MDILYIIYWGFVYMKLRKKLSLFMSGVLLVSTLCTTWLSVPMSAFTPDTSVYSGGVYMVNLDTDICVYQKNATQKCYPASTTKIMTCLVALEMITDMEEKVKVTYTSTNEFWEGDKNKEGPSNAAIEVGQENLTYKDCLYALMLASACEAANVIAYNLGNGDIQAFVNKMNEKANELGCQNTHFANPHGLHDEDNYSTPYDMFLISKYAYDNFPMFMTICNTYSYDMPANTYNPDGYTIYHTNKLINSGAENIYYYEYASGIKTGSIDYYYDAKTGEITGDGCRCLVSTAKKGQFTYMLVTMDGPYRDDEGKALMSNFLDHIALYKWAFSSFEYTVILSKTDIMGEIPVELGEEADHITLKPIDDFATLLPNNLDKTTIQTEVTKNYETLTAPVEKGTVVGTVKLKLAGETLATIDLVSAEGITLSQMAYMIKQLKEIIDTWWFRLLVILLAALIIALVILSAIRTSRRQKAAKKKQKPNYSSYGSKRY